MTWPFYSLNSDFENPSSSPRCGTTVTVVPGSFLQYKVRDDKLDVHY